MGRGGQASIMMAMGAQVYNDIERRPNLNWKPRWSPYLNLSWNSCLPRKMFSLSRLVAGVQRRGAAPSSDTSEQVNAITGRPSGSMEVGGWNKGNGGGAALPRRVGSVRALLMPTLDFERDSSHDMPSNMAGNYARSGPYKVNVASSTLTKSILVPVIGSCQLCKKNYKMNHSKCQGGFVNCTLSRQCD